MKIKEFTNELGQTINRVEFYTCFYYTQENFRIWLEYYNGQEMLDGRFIDVQPTDVQEWMELAKIYPEKATFLNFSLIVQWACEKFNIEPIAENT